VKSKSSEAWCKKGISADNVMAAYLNFFQALEDHNLDSVISKDLPKDPKPMKKLTEDKVGKGSNQVEDQQKSSSIAKGLLAILESNRQHLLIHSMHSVSMKDQILSNPL
jgi:hypothetical protein